MNATAIHETQVLAAASMLPQHAEITLPFSALFLSADNVRQQPPSAERIKTLAALIKAQGLLNPLLVSPELKDGQPTGRYAVDAGGRRWRALATLLADGHIAADEPIKCALTPADSAVETSLTENVATEPMNPADEFQAFLALSRQGKSAEAIAASFGVTVVHVLRRMKLASVAPELFKLYREQKASLDQLMALASVDDPKRQLSAWKSMPDYNRSASALKRKLLEEEVSESDDRVKLITLARYEVSGGTTRRDLFTDELFLTDAGLVDYIVAEVLTERADQLAAEGYGWVEPLVCYDYEAQQRFREAPKKFRVATDAERVEREALETELAALDERLSALYDEDETDEAEAEKLRGQCDELRKRLNVMQRALIDPNGYDKAALGAIVTQENGKLKVVRGLMTLEQLKAATRTASVAAAGAAGGASGEAPKRAEYSEKIMMDLTSHRTAAIQVAMIERPQVALVMLAARLATSVLVLASSKSPVKLRPELCRSALQRDASGFAGSAAAQALDAARARWIELLPEDSDEWFGFLLQQSSDVVLGLIAFCTAHCVDTVQRRAGPDGYVDEVVAALDLDMSRFWQPTEAAYLSHVTKAQMIAAVTEAKGAEAAQPMLKMKSAEARAHAERELAGTNWLPTPLRRAHT